MLEFGAKVTLLTSRDKVESKPDCESVQLAPPSVDLYMPAPVRPSSKTCGLLRSMPMRPLWLASMAGRPLLVGDQLALRLRFRGERDHPPEDRGEYRDHETHFQIMQSATHETSPGCPAMTSVFTWRVPQASKQLQQTVSCRARAATTIDRAFPFPYGNR